MTDAKTINIEVAYALPEQQVIIPLQVNIGTTIVQAIELSGVLEQFNEIDLASCKLGIFGKAEKPDTELREKDRVEIYRRLIADPKESRRKRADKKKAQAEENK